MTMELSTIIFYMNSQPDFELLKERGWCHPPGLREGEILPDSLIKEFLGKYQIQIVHHTRVWDYTEAFLHDIPERPVMKKGEGTGMPKEIAIALIEALYKECTT